MLRRVNYFTPSKVFIKAVKVVLELSKLAKQSYNTEEQLNPCRY